MDQSDNEEFRGGKRPQNGLYVTRPHIHFDGWQVPKMNGVEPDFNCSLENERMMNVCAIKIDFMPLKGSAWCIMRFQ